MRFHKPTEPFEYVILSILVVIALLFAGTALLLTNDYARMPCITPIIGCVIGILLILLNDKQKQMSAWGIGASIFAVLAGSMWGGLGFFTPEEGLLMLSLLCFGPGLFIALSGVGAYVWQMRQAVYAESNTVEQFEFERQERETAVNPTIQAYQKQLQRVTLYRQQIYSLIQQLNRPQLADQLQTITQEFNRWENHVTQLIQRLINFEQDQLTQYDLVSVPQAIAQLEKRLTQETNPTLRQDIQTALQQMKQHQTQLAQLTTLMQRTQLDIDEMIALMGTIHSQLHLLSASDIDNARAQRLSHDIHEEANRLNDLLSALEEVYAMNGDE